MISVTFVSSLSFVFHFTSANFAGTPVGKVCLTSMSDPSVKEIFLSRVRTLLKVLSSRNSGDEES